MITTAAFLVLVLFLRPCLVAIGNALVHKESVQPAELLLIDNFGSGYSLFKTTAPLLRSGYASRVAVHVRTVDDDPRIEEIERGFAEVLSETVGVERYEVLPVHHDEPISLNVARQITGYLERQRVRSVIVVTPRHRSERSYLVYTRVLSPLGIDVQCVAAEDERSEDWWETWHGTQDIGLELVKYLYYRLWVLRRFDSLVGLGGAPQATAPTDAS